MSNKFDECTIGDSFEVIDYVTLAEEAAQRTRWTAIILVVASVIVFIGFYNSTQWSWATNRLNNIYQNEDIALINTGYKGRKPILDSFFSIDDFRDSENLKNFICRIVAEQEPSLNTKSAKLSKYLLDRLNVRTIDLAKDECADEKRKDPLSDLLRDSVLFDLNTALKDKLLYKHIHLAYYKEPQTELDLLYNKAIENKPDNKLKINESIRLNRLLLEEIYDEILKSRDIIPVNSDDSGNILSSGEKRLLDRQVETTRAYIDNTQTINIPVFGVVIDVNDLGLIGGISLFIILLLHRFSLSREIKNLNISFREAFRYDKLEVYYHNLAMRQVLTVPEMKGEVKNTVLNFSAKLIPLLPAIVMILGVAYDFYSVIWLEVIPFGEVTYLMVSETILALIILLLSLRCLGRKLHIDQIWDDYYFLIKNGVTINRIYKIKSNSAGAVRFPYHKNKIERIVRERLYGEPDDNRFWLWRLLLLFPQFLENVCSRIFVRNRFVKSLSEASPVKWISETHIAGRLKSILKKSQTRLKYKRIKAQLAERRKSFIEHDKQRLEISFKQRRKSTDLFESRSEILLQPGRMETDPVLNDKKQTSRRNDTLVKPIFSIIFNIIFIVSIVIFSSYFLIVRHSSEAGEFNPLLIITATGVLLGGIGNLITAYVNLRDTNREKKEKDLRDEDSARPAVDE